MKLNSRSHPRQRRKCHHTEITTKDPRWGINTHTHTLVHTHHTTHTYIHTHTTYTHTYNTHIHTHHTTHTYIHTHSTYTYTYNTHHTHIHTHTGAQTYIHTYIHTHRNRTIVIIRTTNQRIKFININGILVS